MQKSESITNIAKALVEFHKNIGVIEKKETNPFFKSKYAGLPSVQEATKEPLAKAGLTLVQFPHGKCELTTLLMHAESGEWLMDTYEMMPSKNDPQGIGSAITYMRRYAQAAILNLNCDEDDDGNAASNATAKDAKTTTQQTTKRTQPVLKSPAPVVTVSSPDAVETVQLYISEAGKDLPKLKKLVKEIGMSVKLSPADKEKYQKVCNDKIFELEFSTKK